MTRVTGTPPVFPSAMNGAAAGQLEFPQVLDVVAGFAISESGAARVRARVPDTDPDAVREELAAVAELARLFDAGKGFSPPAIPDVRPILAELGVPGSALPGPALAEVGEALRAIAEVAAELGELSADGPRVAALRVDPPPSEVGTRLDVSLEPDGSVKDQASRELARARRDIRTARSRVIKLLEDLMRRYTAHLAAADAAVTMRGGRYVIPVRRESAARVKGIVHGESGSGATLFVEPQEAVGLGNALQASEAEESRAVHKVLRDLSEFLRPHVEVIAGGWEMCVRVDDLYARARYAVEVDAVPPAIVAAPAPVVIRRGRHPLLLAELDRVVPFDLETDAGESVVVVSGPNTGGKTVLLKSVGLLAGMAQAGILPPVGEGTVLPVFTSIVADIGDHQSIAASLSTFSGHIEALRGVLETTSPTSLVLLDEFGTGTDPTEGAALAGAVLQTLCGRGGLTIATTHLNQLKELAADTDGAVNASLQFDPERLEPTYRVVRGIPGRSYGLAIARRLGFPPDVLALAEQMMPDADRSLDTLLADVEAREKDLAAREEDLASRAALAEAQEDGLEAMRSELADRARALDDERRALEVAGRAEARRFLLDARKRVEEALGLARAAVTEATAKEARRLVETGVNEEGEALKKLEARAQEMGWTVRGRPHQRAPSSPPSPPAAAVKRRRAAADVVAESATTEIDLRGMTSDDAEVALLQALDAAVVAGLTSVRVIHGKGTGALRQRVQHVLKRDRRVRGSATPPPHLGGWGVTVVDLKS